MGKWQGAHVGEDSTTVALRLTEEEKQRLEQLRGDLRLTSKGQVIRAALDLLEMVGIGAEALTGGDVAEAKRIMRRARRGIGVPRPSDLEAAAADDAVAKNRDLKTSYKHVVGRPDAGDGSSDPAPAADLVQEQAA